MLLCVTAHAAEKSRVVVGRTSITAALCTLTGQTNAVAAWQQFVSPGDVVGLKVNTAAAPLHVPSPGLIAAIVTGLRQAGVTNIIVFDRDPKTLTDAEYRADGCRVVPIIGEAGWDAEAFIESKIVGRAGWGDLSFGKTDSFDPRSHLPKLLTQTITKLINVPVFQDHEATGLSGALYNLSLGLADNTRRFEQYGQRGEPAVAELCLHPAMRRKYVLTIADVSVAGYAGGPAFKLRYSWNPGKIYVSRDPVAIDALMLEEIEARRREANIPAIGDQASHVKSAALAGLGQADRAQIDVVEVPAR